MITVVTAGLPAIFKIEKTANDPGKLDRWADVLVSQGFPRQAERLAHQAADLREAGR